MLFINITESLTFPTVEGTQAAEPQEVSTKDPTQPKPMRTRLSVATLKRYRRLIAEEMEAKKAFAVCKKAWAEISSDLTSSTLKAHKRLRSDEEFPKEQPNKTSRLGEGRPNEGDSKPRAAYNAMAGSSKSGI